MAEARSIAVDPPPPPPPMFELTLTKEEAEVVWMTMNYADTAQQIRDHFGEDHATYIRQALSDAGLTKSRVSIGFIAPTEVRDYRNR